MFGTRRTTQDAFKISESDAGSLLSQYMTSDHRVAGSSPAGCKCLEKKYLYLQDLSEISAEIDPILATS
jgi:hypothetical protein